MGDTYSLICHEGHSARLDTVCTSQDSPLEILRELRGLQWHSTAQSAEKQAAS